MPISYRPYIDGTVKPKRLSELYGALPAMRPFPGKEAVRDEVGRILGEEKQRLPRL